LRVAVRHELESPESELVASAIRHAGHHVTEFGPWDIEAYAQAHDVAVCVGPVSSCPLARQKHLLVMGMTASHEDLGWDRVIVTSRKASRLVKARFGHGVRVKQIEPPLLDLDAGKRRIVDQCRGLMHMGECATEPHNHVIRMLTAWGNKAAPKRVRSGATWAYPVCKPHAWFVQTLSKPKTNMVHFTAREFNSLVMGGAVGFYPGWMEDGYDMQVRRHLALGGQVFCRLDSEVIGDLADLCLADPHTNIEMFMRIEDVPPNQESVSCAGNVDEYVGDLLDFLRL